MRSFLQKIFGKYFPLFLSVCRHFITAFVGTFVPLATGIWVAPNLPTAASLAAAALVASLAAGARAVYAAVKSGELPWPNFGL